MIKVRYLTQYMYLTIDSREKNSLSTTLGFWAAEEAESGNWASHSTLEPLRTYEYWNTGQGLVNETNEMTLC